MRFVVTVVIALTSLSPLLSDERSAAEAKAKAILLLAQAERLRVNDGYAAALDHSIKSQKPLAVLVGVDRPDLSSCKDILFAHVPANWNGVENGIVLSKGGSWIKTLPPNVTHAALHTAAGVPQNAASIQSINQPFYIPGDCPDGKCYKRR